MDGPDADAEDRARRAPDSQLETSSESFITGALAGHVDRICDVMRHAVKNNNRNCQAH